MANDMKTVNKFMDYCWQEIFNLIKNAAVYIDHTMAECLHWYTGDKAYSVLKNCGAISVHEIAMYNFSYVKVQNTRKAVLIAASPESSFYDKTLRMIIEKNDFEEFVIVCAACPEILNLTSIESDDEDNYVKLKNNVIKWMGRDNCRQTDVRIMYKPIFVAAINEDLFVTPPFGHLMPSIGGTFSDECETDVEYFISSFNSLFAYYQAKEDVYALGGLSEYLLHKFENSSRVNERRKSIAGKQGVSLILVDRTLDLCLSTSYNTESLLGRICCTLPKLTHHQNDVAINMSCLCTDTEDCVTSSMVSGCLATKDTEMLDMLLVKKQKDILLALNKMLIDMCSLSSPKTRISTRVSVHSLEKCVQNYRNTENVTSLANHSKKLQHIIAVIQALKSDKTNRIELLIGLEKLILQNLAISRDSSSVLNQISNIIKTRANRGLETEDILILLIHVYALTDPDFKFAAQQESQLESTLEDAVFEDIKRCNEATFLCGSSAYYQSLLLLGVEDDQMAKQSAHKITRQIMGTLHLVAKCRQNLQTYRTFITKQNPQEAQCRGIIEQLVTDLLKQVRTDIPDLKKTESSSIASSLNRLIQSKKSHHPSDNPWIIIYVLGGITANEAKIVKDLIASMKHPCPKITLAGSRLLNPSNVLDQVLISNLNVI